MLHDRYMLSSYAFVSKKCFDCKENKDENGSGAPFRVEHIQHSQSMGIYLMVFFLETKLSMESKLLKLLVIDIHFMEVVSFLFPVL